MKEIFLLSVFILLSSCQHDGSHNHGHEDNHESEEKNTHHSNGDKGEEPPYEIDIIGKTIEYKYGESIYHLTVDTDSTLHWRAMTGEEEGVTGEENYILDRLSHGEIFITWGEENGTGVSQVLDFKNGTVFNHLSWDRKVATGTGEIRILD